jgi:probable rRNA maturation factor
MTPRNNLDILIDAPGWTTRFDDIEALCRRAIDAALAAAPPHRGDRVVSVLFTSDATMRRLNASYRGQDKATNVLSFPADADADLDDGGAGIASGEPPFLGDIAIGLEAVLREAEDEGKPPADHVCHLIVHGTLHLLGYDHDGDTGAHAMERLEVQVLAGLGVPDPYEPLMERDR